MLFIHPFINHIAASHSFFPYRHLNPPSLFLHTHNNQMTLNLIAVVELHNNYIFFDNQLNLKWLNDSGFTSVFTSECNPKYCVRNKLRILKSNHCKFQQKKKLYFFLLFEIILFCWLLQRWSDFTLLFTNAYNTIIINKWNICQWEKMTILFVNCPQFVFSVHLFRRHQNLI